MSQTYHTGLSIERVLVDGEVVASTAPALREPIRSPEQEARNESTRAFESDEEAREPNLAPAVAEPGTSSSRLGQASARPELQLLIACARIAIDRETQEEIRALLLEDIDWDFLLEKANQHCVTPLLCLNLSKVCPEAVPGDILKELRDCLHARTHYNLYVTAELLRLLRLLEARMIPTLPFKGPTLAALAYGSLGLRQFGDLDILVRKQDVATARNVLLGEGYKVAGPLTLVQRFAPLISRRKDIGFVSADGKVRVELHWLLSGRHFSFPLNTDNLWEGLGCMSLAGSTVRSLPPAELLLFLCMHGSRHGWGRLGWIVDVAELIRAQPHMDWDQVFEQAASLGCARCLGLGLLLATELLGASVPAGVMQRLSDDSVGRTLCATVRQRLFNGSGVPISIPEMDRLMVRERLGDRIRLRLHYYHRWYSGYRHTVVTPNANDRALLRLPRSLSFLYYLVRPIRLVGAYVLKPLARHLQKNQKS